MIPAPVLFTLSGSVILSIVSSRLPAGQLPVCWFLLLSGPRFQTFPPSIIVKAPIRFGSGLLLNCRIKPAKNNRKSILSSLFKKPPSAGDIQAGRQPQLFHILHRAAEAPVSDAQHRKRRLQTRHLITAGWRRDAADSLSVRPMFQKTFSVYHSPLNPRSKFPQ